MCDFVCANALNHAVCVCVSVLHAACLRSCGCMLICLSAFLKECIFVSIHIRYLDFNRFLLQVSACKLIPYSVTFMLIEACYLSEYVLRSMELLEPSRFLH